MGLPAVHHRIVDIASSVDARYEAIFSAHLSKSKDARHSSQYSLDRAASNKKMG